MIRSNGASDLDFERVVWAVDLQRKELFTSAFRRMKRAGAGRPDRYLPLQDRDRGRPRLCGGDPAGGAFTVRIRVKNTSDFPLTVAAVDSCLEINGARCALPRAEKDVAIRPGCSPSGGAALPERLLDDRADSGDPLLQVGALLEQPRGAAPAPRKGSRAPRG